MVWWRVAVGIVFAIIGLLSGRVYMVDVNNMFMGGLAVFTLAPAAFFFWWSFKAGETGFNMSRKKHVDRSNAIIIMARKNGNGKDVPVGIKLANVRKLPPMSTRHYVRNWRKHMYEFINDTANKKLIPVTMPDKTPFPPEYFQLPAIFQPYKDAVDYTPPTMMQKIAPGILLLTMVIIGILMVMTTPTP